MNNLTVRKVYGQDQIRYLHCRTCKQEFSERKGSALWNTKVSEEKAQSVAAHLAEGCSMRATQRLTGVDRSVVVRLNRRLGKHGQALHDARVKDVKVEALRPEIFSVPYQPARQGARDARCVTLSRARWRMSRPSSIVKERRWSRSRCVSHMARRNALIAFWSVSAHRLQHLRH
jgi:transposase-like protein